jgi:hypothetical protein
LFLRTFGILEAARVDPSGASLVPGLEYCRATEHGGDMERAREEIEEQRIHGIIMGIPTENNEK